MTEIVLAGHIYAPIGMGEHVRCSHRALREAGIEPGLKDIYGLEPLTDPDFVQEFATACGDGLSPDVNVFHINADEVDPSLAHLAGALPKGAYNIIYPAWELSVFPQPWVAALSRFDEIWAPSSFIAGAVSRAVDRPVIPMPLACEVRLSSFVGRRALGLPESAFIFGFFFDFTSYLDRKNPFACLEAFRRLVADIPTADVALVVKTNAARAAPAELERFRAAVAAAGERVHVIDALLTDNETKNLVRCCDCFVSLHRSEGYGRGMSEAMYLGKPVIATGYSGNMEFMTPQTSYLVDHTLIPVRPGQYPFAEGQVWADPDIDHATRLMRHVMDNPGEARARGEAASRRIRQGFSYRAVGLRYRQRLETIASDCERQPARAR
jgi:glycosyltransferase involved in cell wall biosynthesis